jgi:hypothetical protein
LGMTSTTIVGTDDSKRNAYGWMTRF